MLRDIVTEPELAPGPQEHAPPWMDGGRVMEMLPPPLGGRARAAAQGLADLAGSPTSRAFFPRNPRAPSSLRVGGSGDQAPWPFPSRL